ncbi:hypothetical protein RRG08_035910 [Elysia crispata]|uniref:Uncharacterized protein n=1 Tax=Elysia crispata TaxID=231223 RepID=A0AAE1A3V7_9GAST|nr:hypothetical protein RRG08_035910 [Elysia crispata]
MKKSKKSVCKAGQGNITARLMHSWLPYRCTSVNLPGQLTSLIKPSLGENTSAALFFPLCLFLFSLIFFHLLIYHVLTSPSISISLPSPALDQNRRASGRL